jgi:hypothetical protein
VTLLVRRAAFHGWESINGGRGSGGFHTTGSQYQRQSYKDKKGFFLHGISSLQGLKD